MASYNDVSAHLTRMSMPEACCPVAEPSRHNQPRERQSLVFSRSFDDDDFRTPP
jgi:hypothetical protein